MRIFLWEFSFCSNLQDIDSLNLTVLLLFLGEASPLQPLALSNRVAKKLC